MPPPALVAEHRNRPRHDNHDPHDNMESHYGQKGGLHRGNRNTEHDGGVVRHRIASPRAPACVEVKSVFGPSSKHYSTGVAGAGSSGPSDRNAAPTPAFSGLDHIGERRQLGLFRAILRSP